jgi:hypothetical protein
MSKQVLHHQTQQGPLNCEFMGLIVGVVGSSVLNLPHPDGGGEYDPEQGGEPQSDLLLGHPLAVLCLWSWVGVLQHSSKAQVEDVVEGPSIKIDVTRRRGWPRGSRLEFRFSGPSGSGPRVQPV